MKKMLLVGFLLISVMHAVGSPNYADTRLDALEVQLNDESEDHSPVRYALLAEQIYFLGHETGDQARITRLLESIFEKVENQELKAEVGLFLTQKYRETGENAKVEKLVASLGFIPDWQLLGPLKAQAPESPVAMIEASTVSGYDRQVSWIPIRTHGEKDYWGEGFGQYGFFTANSAIFPNQLTGIMLTTWFHAPEKGVYRLGLGFGNQVVAWVNRTTVHEQTRKQTPHPDQAAAYFKVKRGWHRLTLYFESADDSPDLGYFIRLTDTNGQPLKTDADRRRKVPNSKATLVDPPEKSLIEMAETAYEKGSMLLIKEIRDASEHGVARDYFLQALKASADLVTVEKLIALSGDPNQSWSHLSSYLESHPDSAWAYTQKGQIALQQSRFWEARNYAHQALDKQPNYWPATVLENDALAGLGLDGEALRNLSALLEKYPNVPWLMMKIADLYDSIGYDNEAEAMTDKILAVRRSNAKFIDRKIAYLRNQGKFDELDAFYGETLRHSPYDVRQVMGYADFLIANDKYIKAEKLLGRYLGQLPENPFLLQLQGELKLAQGDPEALPILEKSLALRPQNPVLENLIKYSKEEGGEFYADYRLTDPQNIKVLERSSVVINLDNTVTKVLANGQSSMFHQLEYAVIDKQANQELPGYGFSYAPLRQKATVLKAEIQRGEETLLLTNMGRRRISDPQYRMYYDLVSYQIAFPALEPGDIIRVEYRIDDIDNHNIYGDYFGDLHYFSEGFPIKRKAYTLIIPKQRKIYHHMEKLDAEFTKVGKGDDHVYRWVSDGIPPYESEPRMPGLESYLPYLSISTFDDWQAMATWYHNLINEQLILDSKTKAIAHDLVEGVSDRREMVKRIHEYVVTHTRYVALEFGIHGYKPYEVNQVCTRQFGDCKDKAGLIVAMLREVGVPANIVITRTSDKGDIHPYPAMLSYFNHAIAHVPEFDMFLDGTAEFSGVDELPEMDQGALVLIVDEKGKGELTKIPVYENNRQDYAFELDVQPSGVAQIKGAVSFEGVATPSLRQYLSIQSELDRNVEDLLVDMLPGLDVSSADRKGYSINDPISIHFEGQSRQLLQVSDTELRLPLNVLSDGLTSRYTPNSERRFPMVMGPPRTKLIQVRVKAPQGFRLSEVPDEIDLSDHNFGFKISFDAESQSECVISYSIAFNKNRIETPDYASLRNLMQAHDKVLDRSIRFVAEQ